MIDLKRTAIAASSNSRYGSKRNNSFGYRNDNNFRRSNYQRDQFGGGNSYNRSHYGNNRGFQNSYESVLDGDDYESERNYERRPRFENRNSYDRTPRTDNLYDERRSAQRRFSESGQNGNLYDTVLANLKKWE